MRCRQTRATMDDCQPCWYHRCSLAHLRALLGPSSWCGGIVPRRDIETASCSRRTHRHGTQTAHSAVRSPSEVTAAVPGLRQGGLLARRHSSAVRCSESRCNPDGARESQEESRATGRDAEQHARPRSLAQALPEVLRAGAHPQGQLRLRAPLRIVRNPVDFGEIHLQSAGERYDEGLGVAPLPVARFSMAASGDSRVSVSFTSGLRRHRRARSDRGDHGTRNGHHTAGQRVPRAA